MRNNNKGVIMTVITQLNHLFNIQQYVPVKALNILTYQLFRFFDPPSLSKNTFTKDPFNTDLEYLTKVGINHPLREKQTIFIEGRSYSVHRKIAAEGLVSYALKSNDDLTPILLFRCTEINPFKEAAFDSMQNDVATNLGEMGYLAARESFRELMNDPTFRNADQKIRVAGYSLGGAHAQYFIAEHHASVSHGIFYSDPGIQAKIVEAFAKNIQKSLRKEPLILQIFRTYGDPFPLFGDKHLGCGVDHPNVRTQLFEIDVKNQYSFDPKLHSKRIFSTDDYTVYESRDPAHLSRKLDNARRNLVSPLFETTRQQCGGCLSVALKSGECFFSLLRQRT